MLAVVIASAASPTSVSDKLSVDNLPLLSTKSSCSLIPTLGTGKCMGHVAEEPIKGEGSRNKNSTEVPIFTSSIAQGGGGSFKNRKRIGDWLL